MTGIWVRNLSFVLCFGLLLPVLLKRDWPDGGPVWWAVFLGGLLVIALGCSLGEIHLRRRGLAQGARESTGDADPR